MAPAGLSWKRVRRALTGTRPVPVPVPMVSVRLGLRRPWGYVDVVEIDSCGILRLLGWSTVPPESLDLPAIVVNGRPVEPCSTYRFARADVPAADGAALRQGGLAVEFLFGPRMAGAEAVTSVAIDGVSVDLPAPVQFRPPDYGALLFGNPAVLHRQHIYASGPPSPAVHPDVAEAVSGIAGPVLDFGCGSGALVALMRLRGVDAVGLELDRPDIRAMLPADGAPPITFYDGRLPSPFPDGAFETVTCFEVLEHIEDYQAAIREMARLTRHRLILSVPDMEAIPLGFRHGVVPWHLLDATHVNFFTQRSLAAALAPHFPRVEFGRVGYALVNGARLHTSVLVVATKQPA